MMMQRLIFDIGRCIPHDKRVALGKTKRTSPLSNDSALFIMLRYCLASLASQGMIN